MAERAVSMESRLAEAIATEAKALGDIGEVMDDRLEYEMLAAEAGERADVMKAEKDVALRIAHDAEKKVARLSVTILSLSKRGWRKGSGCESFGYCAGLVPSSLLQLHCTASPVYIAAELSLSPMLMVDAVVWRAVVCCLFDALSFFLQRAAVDPVLYFQMYASRDTLTERSSGALR